MYRIYPPDMCFPPPPQNLESRINTVGSATLRLFSRICIGFRFATELVSKLPRLLSECSSLSSHPMVYLSSLIPRYVPARALRSSSSFSICVPPRKTTITWQLPNHFHLLLQVFGIHCQTICLPFQLFLF